MQKLGTLPQIAIPPRTPIRDFVGIKQSSLFHTLKKPQFTGQLNLYTSHQKEDPWTFYFYLGRIIYATGGQHPIKRWMRSIKKIVPNSINKLYVIDLQILPPQSLPFWDYELLRFWLAENMITVKNVHDIIQNILEEILFDISQAMEVCYEICSEQPLSNPLVFMNPDQIVHQASKVWNIWQNSHLADRCPNDAPIILQPQEMEKVMSVTTYRLILKYFNGKNTLRDLSILLNQDIVFMTKVILPYIQRNFLQLVSIDDVTNPLIDKEISNMIAVN